MKKRWLVVLLFCVFLSIGGYFSIKYKNIFSKEENNFNYISENIMSEKSQNDLIVQKEVPKQTYTASMAMVGDFLIHSSVYKEANQYANYNGYDFKPMLEFIKPLISQYDIKYYNQETILGGAELGVSTYPMFNSPYEAGDAMIDAGFNFVSLATNHTMDRGKQAVLNSKNYWDSKQEVLTSGSYKSEEDRNTIKVAEVNNIKFAMLNYTYGTNGMPVPSDSKYLINVWPTNSNINNPVADTNYQEYKNQVQKDIEAVRNQVDVLIVAMHWGEEYTHIPTEYEIDAAQFLASQGVDIIIGTHPHVIQPVTWIGNTLVIYSLGNFLSAQKQDANYNKMVGLMTSLEIVKNIENNETTISIQNVKNELLYTYHKSYHDFKVIPFSQMNSGYLSNYQEIYEKYKKIVQMYDENMVVEPLINP